MSQKTRYEYDYPMAGLTTDVVFIRLGDQSDGPKCPQILLIKRKNDPFKDCWALPGGYVDVNRDNSVVEAAVRELKEETGIEIYKINLRFLNIFDTPNRDPRGRTISFAFYFFGYDWQDASGDTKYSPVAGDDAGAVKFIDIDALEHIDLAFDHKKIVHECLDTRLYKTYDGIWTWRDKEC